ncbi:hypothetical protein SDC9_184168 [bioreactor metagenome]|uniref:Uncharacterized protein n=1 Tax=bioreactor metagenome TaxID=1076179 RepID=A0A645HCA2_9ZZZZ
MTRITFSVFFIHDRIYQVVYPAGLTVTQQHFNLLFDSAEFIIRQACFILFQTDITAAAVPRIFLVEIDQQHPATAYSLLLHITDHGMDPFLKAFFSFLVYCTGDGDKLRFLPRRGKHDKGRFLLRNITDIAQAGERNQLLGDLLPAFAGSHGEHRLINVNIIRENTGIVP